MGLAKQYWMELQEEQAYEEKCEWIREYLQDDDPDEYSKEWQEAEDAYEEYLNRLHIDFENQRYEEEYDYWSVVGKTNFQIFTEIIDSSKEIIKIQIDNIKIRKNLFVMLYGHIVAAIESYLSSTFIEQVMSPGNSEYIRKLVESDPEFANRKFTIKEIFSKQEELENDVKLYLRDLIFHKIDKVKPMYKNVLDIDFGNNIEWLFKAISLRHDCVHRAGYDKDGNEIDLDKEKVEDLIKRCSELVEHIESELTT
ncbi:hypothetical protein ACM66T_04940 [Sulfurimonas sp. ST-25]|uniref:hypothetical protein n=1 Tax=Sulfurimonas sp. ST-25 TaxID=3400151 RepID=UPI003A8898DD